MQAVNERVQLPSTRFASLPLLGDPDLVDAPEFTTDRRRVRVRVFCCCAPCAGRGA